MSLGAGTAVPLVIARRPLAFNQEHRQLQLPGSPWHWLPRRGELPRPRGPLPKRVGAHAVTVAVFLVACSVPQRVRGKC